MNKVSRAQIHRIIGDKEHTTFPVKYSPLTIDNLDVIVI